MCDSLLSKCIDSVCDKLQSHLMRDKDILRNLPSPIKDRILRKLLCSAYYWRFVNPKEVLPLLFHASLKKVDLSFLVIDDELLELLKPCRNLQEIRATAGGVHHTTSEGLREFFKTKNRLRVLNLAKASFVTDELVKFITNNCPFLTELVLQGCKQVTDTSLFALSSLHHLIWVDFSGTQITDDGIKMFSKGSSKDKVKQIRIAHCPNITCQGLKAVVENCAAMEIFECNDCCKSSGDSQISLFKNGKLDHIKQVTFSITFD